MPQVIIIDDIKLLSKNWGQIALTDKEPYVIEALQIIDENIERLAFIDEGRKKKCIVKIRNIATPVPLGTIGDGLIRVLRTILALVQCENGTLLIDEFETGLHWSVQAELWKIIFRIAKKLNIQIFATTHSRDTIAALQKVAFLEGFEKDTTVIKLKSLPKTGMIKAVELDIDNVKSALEQGIEIR